MATLQSLRGDYGFGRCSFYEFATILEELLEQNEFAAADTPQLCREWLDHLRNYDSAYRQGLPKSVLHEREIPLHAGMAKIGGRIAGGAA